MDQETEKAQVMDGGLAIFGLGLFLFAVANLYIGANWGVAWVVLALSVLSMGMAFSEYRGRRNVALGMGAVLLLLELWAAIARAPWWIQVLLVAFAAAYFMLWAEYRFPVFGHVGEGETHLGRTGLPRGRHRQEV
ncbi:MAG: hypothetical protein L0Y66_06365 [Myxococcaceae bacterium]|nr:hypothetical protein [Myxococcaceae bacterium]MCI0669120.1 hypothetical protein [Myxococcaceae bacterium]